MRIKTFFTAFAIGTFTAVTALADSVDSIQAQARADASQYYNENKSDPGWYYNSVEVYNYSHRKAAERGFTLNGDDSVYASSFGEYLASLSEKSVTRTSSTPKSSSACDASEEAVSAFISGVRNSEKVFDQGDADFAQALNWFCEWTDDFTKRVKELGLAKLSGCDDVQKRLKSFRSELTLIETKFLTNGEEYLKDTIGPGDREDGWTVGQIVRGIQQEQVKDALARLNKILSSIRYPFSSSALKAS
jgi:hypothetical protein